MRDAINRRELGRGALALFFFLLGLLACLALRMLAALALCVRVRACVGLSLRLCVYMAVIELMHVFLKSIFFFYHKVCHGAAGALFICTSVVLSALGLYLYSRCAMLASCRYSPRPPVTVSQHEIRLTD